MTSPPKPSQEDSESEVEIPTDSESDSDSGTEMTDSQVQKWLTNTFDRSTTKPMKAPLTASLSIPISASDVEKIKAGFRSRNMDDKWDLLAENPDEEGNLSLHIIRNWLHEECYVLHVVPEHEGKAKIEKITWEGNKGGLRCDEKQAMMEAVILCRMMLGCEFEALPEYGIGNLENTKVYKKLDAPDAK
ncbi:atp-dependent dna helicase protein [Rutstroemia sp. NJR-2017a BBW]|nr:atp-dependent dna helicase protein [Rutstroemia sp. NJR-2017a BBW]